jgi:hypothetical protein
MSQTRNRYYESKYILLTSLFRVPAITFAWTLIRFVVLRRVLRRQLVCWSPNPERTINYDYSLSAYSGLIIRPLSRSVIPISIASSLCWPETFNKKILIIGPRFESDHFLARGYGFRKSNITLVDHFSYSNLITCGDAHNLDFPSAYFDLVIASWVLVYSLDHARMLSEIRRVLKGKTGIAIITADLHTSTTLTSTRNEIPIDARHIWTMWPSRDDNLVLNWPTSISVVEGVPQVVVAIQRNDS